VQNQHPVRVCNRLFMTRT